MAEFLKWHYSYGIDYYITSWRLYLNSTNHYFSFFLLIKTFFAPWKKLESDDRSPGFNPSRFFENISFNLMSRGIGACVRFVLLIFGAVWLFLSYLVGAVGLLVWTIIPFFSIPVFVKYKQQPENLVADLLLKIKMAHSNPIRIIFANVAGTFVLKHLGVDQSDWVKNAIADQLDFTKIKITSYQELMNFLVDNKVWSDVYLYSKGLQSIDLIIAGKWWDKKQSEETNLFPVRWGGPGLAMQLLFGYTPTLVKYSSDLLSTSAPHPLIGRSDVMARMERILSVGGSVCLIGPPGVGKKTVVAQFAQKAALGEFGSQMAFHRVLEFNYTSLLSQSIDLNSKKVLLGKVLDEAASAGNIILMIRDFQRLINPQVEGYDLTSIFEQAMEKKTLSIVAISTPSEYERFIAPNMRIRKFLEKVEVLSPSKEEARDILIQSAQNKEAKMPIIIQANTIRYIIDQSDAYISETPFPEKAVELLRAVIEYVIQHKRKVVVPADVDTILSEKTGISFATLTHDEEKKLGNLEEILHERLVSQELAVHLIAQSLRSRVVGSAKEDRPIGSFLFLGPTGVGKTETAKVLAKVYYGSEQSIIRFDMSEFLGQEGQERLIGSAARNQPGMLTTQIKNHPASLLLLDEIEKATPEVFNLFLTLLDEGFITDAFGNKIIAKHLFIIGTSNAGANYIRNLVKDNVKGEELQEKVVDFVLEQGIFTPEFVNRFDAVVVYEPLAENDLVQVAKYMLGELAENIKLKNISLEITDDAAKKLAQDGYDPAFGARPMKRIVHLVIGDLIGKAMLNHEIASGDKIVLVPGEGKNDYTIKKT